MSKTNNWKNSIYYLSDKEIVQYYGQIWENVKHLRVNIYKHREKYIKEVSNV